VSDEFETELIHNCGKGLIKHKPLNDPFCYQLGFQDGARWAREWCEDKNLEQAALMNLVNGRNKQLRAENQSLRDALETIKCRDEASNGDHGLLGIIAKQALDETGGDDGK